MYTSTTLQIIEYIKKNDQVQVKDLVALLGITPAAVHRALNKLMEQGLIDKKGKPPRVFYFLKAKKIPPHLVELDLKQNQILEENYLYIDPTGKMRHGLDGFINWMQATNNYQKIENCVRDYIEIYEEAQSHRNLYGVIDATERFKTIFKESFLDRVYYYDFYSLIKFGKTKIGHLLLHGKQAQDLKIISQISQEIKKAVQTLCEKEKIEAIVWVPHSIQRKVPFLPEVKKNLKLSLPSIEAVKAYQGEVPVAQKSLSKIEERILNASETLALTMLEIPYQRVLIFDDAVGSGATLNELARKLKRKGVSYVVGFAIVGSYKGFEVIKEV